MLELALKARIPIIGVSTDDPINFAKVLQEVAISPAAGERSFTPAKLSHTQTTLSTEVYWTDDADKITEANYYKFNKNSASLVVMNAPTHMLCFDAGILPMPEQLLTGMVQQELNVEAPEAVAALRGLSLKTAREVLLLSMARANGQLTANDVRATRSTVFGAVQGLYPEETSYDFYAWPPGLREWVQLNKPYFLKSPHPKLMPRGILFDGPPGVGKSMAGKAIANEFGVPLYRLDIASTLSKYIGESEARLMKILQMVDRESPCVLLLDEVEKIFKMEADSGVIQRLLSAGLWWLQEHTTRVFTVMTTNDKTAIPPELYRKGRIDLEQAIRKLTLHEARNFCQAVFRSVVGTPADLKRIQEMSEHLQLIAKPDQSGIKHIAHAEVADAVYHLVKKNKWVVVGQ
jgi:hypothetical protein